MTRTDRTIARIAAWIDAHRPAVRARVARNLTAGTRRPHTPAPAGRWVWHPAQETS